MTQSICSKIIIASVLEWENYEQFSAFLQFPNRWCVGAGKGAGLAFLEELGEWGHRAQPPVGHPSAPLIPDFRDSP